MPAPHNSTVPLIDLTQPRQVPKFPFLSYGFRPFFLFSGIAAVVLLAAWIAMVSGALDLPTAMPGVLWHAHEMLFGFVGAAMAGFLLTAVPNWTGRLPVSGARLGVLFALWLAGRIVMAFGASFPGVLVTVIDVGFLATMAVMIGREVWLSGTKKNAPIVLILTLLTLANVTTHAEALGGSYALAETGMRAGIFLVALLTTVIGGRVVPSFTSSWRAKAKGITDDRPRAFGVLDIIALAGLVAAIVFELFAVDRIGVGGAPVAGALWLAAGGLHLLRLSGWKGLSTLSEPIVWVLHLGYLWLIIGFFLLGAAHLVDGIDAVAGLHAVSAGGFGTMILAIMTRASLGHTGRVIRAAPAIVVAYVLVSISALLRILAGLGAGEYLGAALGGTLGIMGLSGLAWVVAFCLFCWVYAPILWKARA